MEALTKSAIQEAAAVISSEGGKLQIESISGGHIKQTWLVEERGSV